MGTIIKIIGYVLFVIAFLIVVIGNIVMMIKRESSPLSFNNGLMILIVLAPGLGLITLGKKIEDKRREKKEDSE